jgi:outer membrane protein OmpA-like peptidoglycan-associated protein
MTKQRLFLFFLSLTYTFLFIVSPAHSQNDAEKKILDRGLADTHTDNLTNLNSKFDDVAPIVSKDEGTLYFTSYRSGKEAIYKATRKSVKEWNDPVLFLELPGKEKISSLSMSGDGKTVIVSSCDRSDGINHTCDIYQCDIVDGKMQNIRSLGPTINTEWWDSQPNVSEDGQLLFFASDRKHGAGGEDIYMCTRNVSGGWNPPILLSFCTSGNEVSPFISKDNQTLYFASDDLPGGQGGYDIYVTYRTGDNTWSQPKNLGPAVNSKGNELTFAVPPTEDALYVASDREGGLGNFDIYRISPNPVKAKPKLIAFRGKVLDAETGQPVRSEPEVMLGVRENGEKLGNQGTSRDYRTMAPIGKLITIGAGAGGYVDAKIEVQAPSVFSDSGFSEDIKLVPAKAKIFGHVTNVFTRKPVEAPVMLEELDASNNPTANKQTANTKISDGCAFEFDAKPFVRYRISAVAPNYDTFSAIVEIPLKREPLIRTEKEVRLQPADIDAVMVFFDLDKSDLKPDQSSKMTRFIQQVKENPYVKLEVHGHTDDQGSEQYNDKLSQRRASAVEDYLMSQGVPRDQLAIVKGFGKSAPLVFGTSEEARAKNRRCEVRIVGKQ